MKYASLLSKIKRSIDCADVISFDVFDTLLLRPYLNPTDLFLHIEKIENISGFANSRVIAESNARKLYSENEEVTLNQIYEQIDEAFKHLKQFEVEWEIMVLIENPEMKQIWDYAKHLGKKIIIISDMYLPMDVIATALYKNNFINYDKLYVSSEIGKTKHSGSLYQYVLNDLNLQATNILHIGDNKKADVKKASEYEIKSVYYVQLKNQYLYSHKRARLFATELKDDLGASILIMMLAMNWQKKVLGLLDVTYWENIGYEYAGPVAYGYSKWIEQQSKKHDIKQLLFIARDGYTLKKVFDNLDTSIKTEYVYAPRLLNLIYKLDYDEENKNQAKIIVEYFIAKDEQLKERYFEHLSTGFINYNKFIIKNKMLIKKLADEELNIYKKYLSYIINDEVHISIVDTKTIGFSSQRLIQSILEYPVLGLYWDIDVNAKILDEYSALSFNGNKKDPIITWNFVEFLLTAPEYPVKGVNENGKPIYDEAPISYEIIRKELYYSVSNKAVSFSDDIKKIFKKYNIFLDINVLNKWINYFCEYPTNLDIKEVAVLRYSSESNHSRYEPIFLRKIPFHQVLAHPKKAIKDIKNALWRTKLQTLLLCIAYPLKIKTRGLKQVKVFFLPKLKNRYFILALNFHNIFTYSVVIGNEKNTIY